MVSQPLFVSGLPYTLKTTFKDSRELLSLCGLQALILIVIEMKTKILQRYLLIYLKMINSLHANINDIFMKNSYFLKQKTFSRKSGNIYILATL